MGRPVVGVGGISQGGGGAEPPDPGHVASIRKPAGAAAEGTVIPPPLGSVGLSMSKPWLDNAAKIQNGEASVSETMKSESIPWSRARVVLIETDVPTPGEASGSGSLLSGVR